MFSLSSFILHELIHIKLHGLVVPDLPELALRVLHYHSVGGRGTINSQRRHTPPVAPVLSSTIEGRVQVRVRLSMIICRDRPQITLLEIMDRAIVELHRIRLFALERALDPVSLQSSFDPISYFNPLGKASKRGLRAFSHQTHAALDRRAVARILDSY